MAISVLQKQPTESRFYDMTFDANLAAGETIASITSLTLAPVTVPPLAVSGPSVWVSGRGIQFRLAGGLTSSSYLVTAVVLTSLGNTLEGEGRLNVLDT